MKEIERKFLVTSLAFLAEATDALHIDQGYLHSTRPTVRVRRRGDQGFLTLKTPSDAKGLVRDEYEYEIPLADAEALLELCGGHRLKKTRYLVPLPRAYVGGRPLRWASRGILPGGAGAEERRRDLRPTALGGQRGDGRPPLLQ